MSRLFVLDAMGLAYRAFHAIRARKPKTAEEVKAERLRNEAAGKPDKAIDPIKWVPLTNSSGHPTNALMGFANTALKLRQEETPDFWVLAWDGPGPTFRHQRFPNYKAQRDAMPEDLVSQLGPLEDLAQALGLPVIEIPGVEADDVMATLAVRGRTAGHDVVLVTADKDMLQLVNDRVTVLAPVARGEELERIDADGVRAKWDVGPEHIRDVLALMGDTSDNIPGVPGVGQKTAVELLKQFGSLEAIYRRLDEVKKPALRAKLESSRELAFLSRELATLKDDLELPYTWEDLRRAPIRRDALMTFAKRFEIRRLEQIAESLGVTDVEAGALTPARSAERRGTAAEMPAEGVKLADVAPRATAGTGAPAPAQSAPALSASRPPMAVPTRSAFAGAARADLGSANQGTLDLWASAGSPTLADAPAGSGASSEAALHAVRARGVHGLALLPVLGGEDPRRSPLIGLALAARDGTACYVPLAHEGGGNLALERAREWLAPALADPTVPKTGWDLKSATHAMGAAGMPLEGLSFDVRIGSFLCDPERDHALEALARDLLGEALPSLEAPPLRGRPRPGFASLPASVGGEAAALHAAALYRIEAHLRAQLESREQWALYETLEHPLIRVLLEMERAGIGLDPAVLAGMSAKAGAEMTRLEAELETLAGERINLNSGQQLARILFEVLKLKPGRKTKTGLSTDSAVLEELAIEHPFPRLVLEYRTLSKLKSTYLDALPLEVDPVDGRIHTTYDTCGAATGRLSSSRPNLQNIPMRTELGRAIRLAFVAPPGSRLVGADYSQIELRVMAHLSGDPQLIAAFESGEDVHANTARRIFGVPEGPLDPQLRARAKVVNFGVMYGMGARSLSQQMGIGLAEAQEFIAGYFRVYARVREFLDQTVERARRDGFVRTLLGRRRWLPGLTSENGALRSFAERAAINTPIQGSAADLMKLAMVRVQRSLKATTPSARLLLQVHDELLVECAERDAESVAARVKAEMEGAFPLRVPLVVSLGSGRTWFDAH